MWGLLFIALIIYAYIRRRQLKRIYDSEDWRAYPREFSKMLTGDIKKRINDEIDRHARRNERRWNRRYRKTWRVAVGRCCPQVDPFAAAADKHAAEFERKAEVPPTESEEQRFATQEEREAYRRARKQASREAGFYCHLMVYGIVIGFLFLVNLLTSSYPWFLWPVLGWGLGLMFHFMGVYGWRFVRERVFDPAVDREVRREVLQEKEALHTEKQASLDELTATFAHEIRNPIAAAKSLVQQMGEDPTSHENVEYAKVALDELARVEQRVSHLLKYAKEEDYHFEDSNLAAVLDSALTQLRPKLEAGKVTVSRKYLSGPTVRADAGKLVQVFSNVIDNAADAMAALEGPQRLEIAVETQRNEGAALVLITDNGCGIAPDKLTKIFNPFYTSKESGTGLGMAVAKKIVEAHRGAIEVHSESGAGTTFEIAIPLADSARDDDRVHQDAELAQRNGHHPGATAGQAVTAARLVKP